MSQIAKETTTPHWRGLGQRQLLRRAVAVAGVLVGLGATMSEASADWQSLGGQLTSRPAVGRNQDGRLEVFARGTDNALWHTWQNTGGGWSWWNPLYGAVTSNPAVSSNLNGKMEVYVRSTDSALYHRWQNAPSTTDWAPYDRLDGYLTSDPTVVQNWDGRQEVFVRSYDNAVWHRWQVVPNGGWSGWSRIAAVATGNIAAKVCNSGGGVNVFYRGPDFRLYWRRQASANGPWEDERYLGGPVMVGDPVVAEFDGKRSDARLVVFVRASDNKIWYRAQTHAYGTEWSDWVSLGGQWTGDPAVASNFDGRLEVVVRAPNGAVFHTWQQQMDTDGGWNGWYPLGGFLSSDAVIAMNRDGRLEIFGIGLDMALWHRWQVVAGGAWN